MRKLLTVTVVTLIMVMGAQAQLETLLFGAISSGANAMIAKNQEKPFSAVKVVFDLYVDVDGQLRYLNGWDPTTQTTVWLSDHLVLKVKPFTNNGPSHDHTFYVNDRVVDWRKVEGGRIKNGQPSRAEGVVGDYPFIRVRDLDWGFNQIKVRVSKTEWGSATFVRLDIHQFMEMAQSESVRLATAGVGNSTFPAIPSFTAQMPDGSIRNFTSVEEMNLALNGRSTPNQKTGPTTGSGNAVPITPGSFPQGSNQQTSETTSPPVQESQNPIELRAITFTTQEYRAKSKEKACQELAAAASLEAPLVDAFQKSIPLQNDQGWALLYTSRQKFSAVLANSRGSKEYASVKTGDIYALFIPLCTNSDDPGDGQLVITIGNNRLVQKFIKR